MKPEYYDVLIPVGLTGGAPAAAIRQLKPKNAVFLISNASAKNIDKVFEVANTGLDEPINTYYKTITTYGSREYSDTVRSLLKAGIPDNVILTGGTTMMQVAVNRIAEIHGSRRYVVLDRRPMDSEQRDCWNIEYSELLEIKDNLRHLDYIEHTPQVDEQEFLKRITDTIKREKLKAHDGVLIKILEGGMK